jgi:hypothetical protein
MVKSGDAGQSYMQAYSDSPVTKAFDQIVERMGKLV